MKFQRKPQIIEALRFDGTDKNIDDLSNFLGTDYIHIDYRNPIDPVFILSKEKRAHKGDYIAKSQIGEIFCIKSCDFDRNYERMD